MLDNLASLPLVFPGLVLGLSVMTLLYWVLRWHTWEAATESHHAPVR